MILLLGHLDFIDPCAMLFVCTVCCIWNKYVSNIWFYRRKFIEVKLPTMWTDEKQSRAEAERRERLEERRSEEKESEERRCRCAKR